MDPNEAKSIPIWKSWPEISSDLESDPMSFVVKKEEKMNENGQLVHLANSNGQLTHLVHSNGQESTQNESKSSINGHSNQNFVPAENLKENQIHHKISDENKVIQVLIESLANC